MLSFSLVIFLLMFSLKLNLLMFIKLIAHFHLIVRDQSAKRDLCQNVMMRKGIFQTCKHPAFKSSNDALRIEFLLTGEEMWEEQAN